jgi:hypothetical protein
MTRRDICILLSPSILFGILAVACFICWTIGQRVNEDRSQQKFDTFVSNVQSGKLELTADRWLEVLRSERAVRNDYFETLVSGARLFWWFFWLSLAGIVFQVGVVFSVRKRLEKK